MKKNILYIILSITLLIHALGVSADECSQSCKISDAPAPALTEYLVNLSSIQSNILEALSQAESEQEGNDELAKTQIGTQLSRSGDKTKGLLASFTSLLSFSDYFGNFDFKITLPITNEIPQEVKRDHKKIENETERFTQILKRSEKRKTSDTIIKDICSGVSNCNIGSITVRDALIMIIKNNRAITRLYETSILDKAFIATDNFVLVSDDFREQIENFYNKDTLGSCSKCDGNTWADLSEKIENISFKTDEFKQGKQKWKDAWTLLRGGLPFGGKPNKNYEAEQAKIYSDFLESEGIPGTQSNVLLNNMSRYNGGYNSGYSSGGLAGGIGGGVSSSNPLFNSANYAQASIENEIDTFSQTLQERFAGEEKVPIVAITKVNSEIRGTEDLKKEIKSMFEDQLPFAQGQDVASQELQLRILRMHFSLIRSINMLDKNKSSTERICGKQGRGDGRCIY